MSWPPDKSNFRPLPLQGYQQAQPLAKAGGDAKAGDVKAGDKAAGDAPKAGTNQPPAKLEEPKDKDQVDQEKTRTGGFDPEKSVSFNNKSGGVTKTDEIGGDGDSIPAGMGVAYAAASQSLEKHGLPPAVAKLRDELSPDISDEAIKEAMFQAALWSNAKPIA